jgi:hypothetical protein
MFEIFKLLWDLVVLREEARKGRLNWKVWVVGFGFAIAIYGIGLPATLLYVAHPEDKPLFIGAIVVIAVLFAGVMSWGIRMHMQSKLTGDSEKPAAQ